MVLDPVSRKYISISVHNNVSIKENEPLKIKMYINNDKGLFAKRKLYQLKNLIPCTFLQACNRTFTKSVGVAKALPTEPNVK